MGQQDLAHKEFYSEPENIKDLIQGFVALKCVEQFDFSTLERENTSFVAKENTERHDDIIWKLRWQDKWVYIYILIEFQSDVDETMPVRIISYVSLLYLYLLGNKNLEYWKEKKGEFNTVYNFIKQGLVTVEQAAKSVGLTKEQLLEGFKQYNLVL